MAKTNKAYVIQHTMVGLHRQGQVLRFSDDHIKGGVDVDRLLALGAIREATEDESEHAATWGDDSAEVLVTFPPVPFQATTEGEAPTTPTEDGTATSSAGPEPVEAGGAKGKGK